MQLQYISTEFEKGGLLSPLILQLRYKTTKYKRSELVPAILQYAQQKTPNVEGARPLFLFWVA